MDDEEAHLAIERLKWVDTVGRYFYKLDEEENISAVYELQQSFPAMSHA